MKKHAFVITVSLLLCLLATSLVSAGVTLVMNSEEDEVWDGSGTPGTNQADALKIPLNTKITGITNKDLVSYYSFKTGNGKNYSIRSVNKTLGSPWLAVELVNENGKYINASYGSYRGEAVSFTVELAPNTTYYLKVYTNEKDFNFHPVNSPTEYALIVVEVDPYSTNTGYWGDGKEYVEGETPGTNQDISSQIPLNTKITGITNKDLVTYYSFKTGEGKNYSIRSVNKTLGSPWLAVELVDENGKYINASYGNNRGEAVSYTVELAPNTTYYLKVYTNEKDFNFHPVNSPTEYVLIVVEDPYSNNTAYWGDGKEYVEGETNLNPGTNQDTPARIPLNATLAGTATDSLIWYFSFRTTEYLKTEYVISATNKSLDSRFLAVVLSDESGATVGYKYAGADGTTVSMSPELQPDTVYYLKLYSNEKDFNFHPTDIPTDYSFTIKANVLEEPSSEAVMVMVDPTSTPTPTPEPMVEEEPIIIIEEPEPTPTPTPTPTPIPLIEVPFELDETQVLFVANEAIFVDEGSAIRALRPVADAILDYPDHQVLIAGTTATYGDQESSAELSSRRAEAVKELLVEVYGVPEEQLLTAGLGFENDPFPRGQDIDADGNFVESEAQRNRRVLVIDAENPTAQSVLGNNAQTLIVPSSLTVKKGEKATITVTAVPDGTIKFKSSNKKIATVSSKGVVKGKKKGSCKITVTVNGIKKSVKIKVK